MITLTPGCFVLLHSKFVIEARHYISQVFHYSREARRTVLVPVVNPALRLSVVSSNVLPSSLVETRVQDQHVRPVRR